MVNELLFFVCVECDLLFSKRIFIAKLADNGPMSIMMSPRCLGHVPFLLQLAISNHGESKREEVGGPFLQMKQSQILDKSLSRYNVSSSGCVCRVSSVVHLRS